LACEFVFLEGNPLVLEFVEKYSGLTSQQIRADPMWQNVAAQKPKHLDQMSEADKDEFKRMLDARFPVDGTLMANVMVARRLADKIAQ
jgi:hypothetical protein